MRRNNRREWFTARRERFETCLSQPIRALVDEMDSRFATFAPEIVGDARTSVFRIHRDVRFSPDKSPYKTAVTCWLWLRHCSFTMSRTLSPDEVLSPRLPATLARDYRALLPLVRWLNSAIGFPPAEHR